LMMSMFWRTHNFIHGCSNALLGSMQKAEYGVLLYPNWVSSMLLMLGGALPLWKAQAESELLSPSNSSGFLHPGREQKASSQWRW
ncbi:hypothetical protein A6R68_17920, partial [Neotoma lepida]